MTLLRDVADARTFFQSIFTQSTSSVELWDWWNLLSSVLRSEQIKLHLFYSWASCIQERAFPGTSLVKYSQNFFCTIEK